MLIWLTSRGLFITQWEYHIPLMMILGSAGLVLGWFSLSVHARNPLVVQPVFRQVPSITAQWQSRELLKSMPLLSLSLGFSETPDFSKQFSAIPIICLSTDRVGPSYQFLLPPKWAPCFCSSTSPAAQTPQVLCQILSLLLPSHFQVLWTGVSKREERWEDESPHFNDNHI